jgi:hypothetical protein
MFDVLNLSQKQWDEHMLTVISTYGKSAEQFSREALSMMKANSTKSFEKFAKRAKIDILPDDNIPYGLRLRLSVLAIITMVSCDTPMEYSAMQDKVAVMAQKLYEECK